MILRCSDWHSHNNDLCIYNQFTCTSAIWSLAFGQRKLKTNSALLNECVSLTPRARCESLGRRRSTLAVNCRHDFTKNLFLAAGLADGKINIWNINTGELTLILKDHQSTVCGIDFTSVTMQLASCSHDTTIKLWDLHDDGKNKIKYEFYLETKQTSLKIVYV